MSDQTNPLKDALGSAADAMAFSSRDWAANHRDAWLYGIIVGWPDDALAEVAAKHQWPSAEIERLRRLRQAVREAAPGLQ